MTETSASAESESPGSTAPKSIDAGAETDRTVLTLADTVVVSVAATAGTVGEAA